MTAYTWKMEWNDGMSVGIPEIDAEHRQFIFLVNEFNHAITERMGLSEIKLRLQNILDDAVQHFAHEEALFKEWNYPDTDIHASMHKAAFEALQEIEAKFVNYNFEPEWINAGLAVKDLLIEHVLTEDMKYAAFYRKSHSASG